MAMLENIKQFYLKFYSWKRIQAENLNNVESGF